MRPRQHHYNYKERSLVNCPKRQSSPEATCMVDQHLICLPVDQFRLPVDQWFLPKQAFELQVSKQRVRCLVVRWVGGGW